METQRILAKIGDVVGVIQAIITAVSRDTVISDYERVFKQVQYVANFEVARTGESSGIVNRPPIVTRDLPEFR